jgi:hypothetical protein
MIIWRCESEIVNRIQSEASETHCDYAYWILSIASDLKDVQWYKSV